MDKVKIFCFGFGQVAENFVNKLILEKKNFDLTVTSRKETHSIKVNNFQFNSLMFNGETFDKNIIKKLEKANHILVSIPPIEGKDIVLKNFESNFKQIENCKWITYLSATSVYGDHNGAWVNEKSPTKPTSSNGIDRLNAENSWINLSTKFNLPIQIFRLAGIYSNDYNILKRIQLGKVQIVDKKNHFFSRVHVEDIGNILFESLNNFKKNEIYNICDDKPSSQRDVAVYGAKLLNLAEPKSIELNKLESEMLKNFYKDSKKVNNEK